MRNLCKFAQNYIFQLSRLDLAPKHPLSANYKGVRIPKVKDFVAECLRLNMKVIIDLKSWESPEETVTLVTSLYSQMPALRTNALVTSFFPQLLYKLRFLGKVPNTFLRNPSVQGTEVENTSAQITFFTLKTLFLGNFSTDFGFTDGFRKNVFGISPH